MASDPSDWRYKLWVFFWNIASHLQIVGIVVSVFHLLILIRKSLRTSAVFIFMIAICISDIVKLGFAFGYKNSVYKHQWQHRMMFQEDPIPDCLKQEWVLVDILGQVMASSYSITRKYSVWLSIIMAMIRTLSVMFPMSNAIQKLTTTKATVISVLIIFWVVVFLDFSRLAVYYRIKWFPDILECFSRVELIKVFDEKYSEKIVRKNVLVEHFC